VVDWGLSRSSWLFRGSGKLTVSSPFVYGLAVGGKLGARDAIRGLADLDQSMGLSGIRCIADCNRSMIRRVQYGGDMTSSR